MKSIYEKMREKRLVFPAVFLLCILAAFYGMHLFVKMTPKSDELWYASQLKDYTLPGFLHYRYIHWTGRIMAEAMIFISLHFGFVVYKLLNPLMIMLAGYSIARLFDIKTDLRVMLFAVLSFGLCGFKILTSTVFWFAGTYNYTVPIAFGLFCMIPFADAFFRGKAQVHPARFALCVIGAIVCSLANEQATMVMVAASLVAILVKLFRKEKVSPLLIILSVLFMIGLAVNVKSPGDIHRWNMEIKRFFPDFETLTIGQHIKYSVNWFFFEIVSQFKAFLIVFSCVPLLFRDRYRGRDKKLLPVFGLISIFAVFSVFLNGYRPLNDFSFFFQHVTWNFMTLRHTLQLRLILLYLFWTVFLALLVYFVCRASEKPLFTLLCFLACFCSMAVMFFSPTIVASGCRVLLVGSICMIVALTGLVKQTKLLKSNTFLMFFGVILAVNLLYILDLWAQSGYSVILC